MKVDWQPHHLSGTLIKLIPLKGEDFETLYEVASDPLIWEQHPDSDRYKEDVFRRFFDKALESETAFLIVNRADDRVIGSTRYYDYDEAGSAIAIGYTFMARTFWGGTYNQDAKKLMLGYAFQFVDQVLFHVGPNNIRSQTAVSRLGAERLGLVDFNYNGLMKSHELFRISKENWYEM